MQGIVRRRERFNSETGTTETVARYFIDHGGLRGRVEVSEAEFHAAFPDQKLDFSQGAFGTETLWQKPVISDGAACLPKRIKDFEAYLAKNGAPTDYTTHRGRPIFNSRAHRKKVLKLLSMCDNDGGYGD